MKNYLDFITEIIHQTPISNLFNQTFDVLEVGDYIKLSKRGAEFLGYFKILNKYNANRSLPGDDTMDVLKVDEFNIPIENHSEFPIIKEDMSYEYTKVGTLDFNGVLFSYKDKYLLTHKKIKEKGEGYKHIYTEDNKNDSSLHQKIQSIFGFDIDFNENAVGGVLQFYNNDILKTHRYRLFELSDEEYKYHFDKPKINKKDIQDISLDDVGFFPYDEAIKLFDEKLLRILKQIQR